MAVFLRFFGHAAFAAVLLLGGCAQAPVSGVPQDHVPQVGINGDVELGCSYFYFLWARHAELRLQFEEALNGYQKALICDPTATYIQRKIPVLLIRMERSGEALQWLTKFLQSTPDDVVMRKLLARVLVREKKYEQAIAEYQYLIKHTPDDPEPRLLLGELYYLQKEYDQSLQTLKPALGMEKGAYRAHLITARIYQRQKHPRQAVSHLKKALEKNWSAEILLEIGKIHSQLNQFDAAAAAYQEILHHDEFNQDARIALFYVYQQQGEQQKATATLEMLRNIAEQPWRVDLTLARLYIQQKKYPEAIQRLLEVVAAEDIPEARYLLGQLYAQEKQYQEALHHLQFLRPGMKYFVDGLFLRVHIYQSLDRIPDAVELMEHMIGDEEIVQPEFFSVVAALYELEDQPVKVAETYQRGLQVFPESDVLLYEYGLLHESQGKRAAAMELMKKVIAVNPEHAAALNFVGYTWADERMHLNKALEYILKAVQLAPENGYIRDSLGWVYYRLGQVENAIKELEKAVELSPQDGPIYHHLGDAYQDNGQSEKALEAYRMAIELLVNDEKEQAEVEEKIRQLQRVPQP